MEQRELEQCQLELCQLEQRALGELKRQVSIDNISGEGAHQTMRYTPQPFRDPFVQTITAVLQNNTVQGWLVGEYVRDCLLGRPVRNATVVLGGDGTGCAQQLADALDGTFVPADAAGVIGRITISRPNDSNRYLELVQGHGQDIATHLRQRDFTINALAVDLSTRQLLDVMNGYADLNRGRLRVTDRRIFHRDPLHLMRAVRLAAALQFRIVPETEALIRRRAQHLARVSQSRIRNELLKLIALEPAAQHIGALDDLHLLQYVLPELVDCQDVTQPKEHTLDVYGHTLQALTALEDLWPWRASSAGPRWHAFWRHPLDQHRAALAAYLRATVPGHDASRWLLLKLAMLLHDVGKPASRTVDDDGEIHFYGHARVGATIARRRLQTLGLPLPGISWVTTIIHHHSRPLRVSTADHTHNRAQRFVHKTGRPALAVALHSAADQLGKGTPKVPEPLRGTFNDIWATGGCQQIPRPQLVVGTSRHIHVAPTAERPLATSAGLA